MPRCRKPDQKQIEANKDNAIGYECVLQVYQEQLDIQDKAIRKYCEENKLNLLNIYLDKGKIEKNIFIELLQVIQPGNFIIVYDLTLIDQEKIITFRDLVRNKGCTFICLNPKIDSYNSANKLFDNITEQKEKKASEQIKNGMNLLSTENRLLCRPPFGYIHHPLRKEFIEDPEQQEVVQKIYKFYLAGNTMTEIVRRLNQEGYGHVLNNNKTKKLANPAFNPTTIGIILRNYGFLKDDKTPPSTYPQRVERFNKQNIGKRNKKKEEKVIQSIQIEPEDENSLA